VIEIVAVTGLSTVQDAGRPGRMHEGIPPGGALVPELLAASNAAVQNPWHEAGIEVFGALTLTARGPVVVASDGAEGRALRAGETWSISTSGARVRYVALRGGIDVAPVLGGRGTLLRAGFGGHDGRPLRRGDVLRSGDAPVHDAPGPTSLDPSAAIRVRPGPDADRFASGALDVLLGSPFEVTAQSDRVGVRLRGAPLPRIDDDAAVSAPMVRGAIQVPRSGEAIVLGPDHPTTGGYPVVATVVRADVGLLLARPVGASVRFAVERDGRGPMGIDRRSP
jgi:5-oxoprolinase (ATP-hydrolysing) subunit C